jgi:hypothetical protein
MAAGRSSTRWLRRFGECHQHSPLQYRHRRLQLPARDAIKGRPSAQRGAIRKLQADDHHWRKPYDHRTHRPVSPDRLLNLGSNRWSFKPEFAVSHPFGAKQKWELDGYANAYFYTDNTAYHGTEILRQQPLPGLEGHISYSFTSSLWASLDTRYSFGGDTFVNGVNQNNPQQNFILGSEVNISLNPQNSLVFEFAKALVHQNGPTAAGFAVKYFFSWGRGYR